MFSKILTVALAAAAIVSAQSASDPAPTGILPVCALTCVQGAAAAGSCSSFADVQCVCSSQAFQTAARQCLEDKCSQEELDAALKLQQTTCSAFSVSGSGALPTVSVPISGPESSISAGISAASESAKSLQSGASQTLASKTNSLNSQLSSLTGAAGQATNTGNGATAVTFSTTGLSFGAMFAVIGAIAGGALIL